jgi:peroxiredoxin
VTRVRTATPRCPRRPRLALLALAKLSVLFSLHVPLHLVLVLLLLGAMPVRALDVGDKAADFEAPVLGGERTLNLKQHRGKVVYLDFWASWCDPCQTALPLIEKLRGEFPKEKFQVLAVNVDKDTKAARKFLQRTPVGYPSVSDPRGKLPRLFGLETMPTSYLIDRNGVIRYVHKGFREEDIPELRAQIAKLVAGK